MERGQQVKGDKDSTATQSQGTGRDGTEAKSGIFDCPQAPPTPKVACESLHPT